MLMKFMNKEISDMTNDELWKASLSLQQMIDDNYTRREASRNKKRFKNLEIPPIGSKFLELKQSLDNELISRNGNSND